MKKLAVYINDHLAHEFDREWVLEPEQLKFLDRMDNDMNRGVKIQGEQISEPDVKQRAVFVAMNLIKALQQDNDSVKNVSSAYLVNRLPGLIEIRANDQKNTISIELVEEH